MRLCAFPPFPSDPSDTGQRLDGGSPVASDSPALAETPLVQDVAVSGRGDSGAVASEARAALQARGALWHLHPSRLQMWPWPLRGEDGWIWVSRRESYRLCKVPEPRLLLQHTGFAWRVFRTWCRAHSAGPVHCDVQTVLHFLQSLLDEGRAANTLKVYVAAISACHSNGSDGQLGKHPLLSRLRKE